MWMRENVLISVVAICALSAGACGGSEDSPDDGASGSGASAGAGAAAGATGTGGATSTGGATASTGGTNTGTGGTNTGTGGTNTGTGGTAMSTGGNTSGQPVGAICVNTQQCDQSGGAAVCCTLPDCTAPCECRLEADCDEGGLFLECTSTADCDRFGGGKVCCVAGEMQYCTKPSGCAGQTLP